mmetsp:Transcript_17025/g.37502  ORF Transcript_17025/g.37502 Transcript_17025/m.37502 type:complete len:271 (+) Transcript_17025:83-895(+)
MASPSPTCDAPAPDGRAATKKLKLPAEAFQGAGVSGAVLSRGRPVATPSNAASTVWRTQMCPYAPVRKETRASLQGDLPSHPTQTASRVLRAPPTLWLACSAEDVSPSPTPVTFTPSDAKTTAWRRSVCPFAPIRREVRLSSGSDFTSLPTPTNFGFSPTSTLTGSTPPALAAPHPVRLLPRHFARSPETPSSAVWPTGSPTGTPSQLNRALIGTPRSEAESSPFWVDATPSALAAGSPTAFFAPFEMAARPAAPPSLVGAVPPPKAPEL